MNNKLRKLKINSLITTLAQIIIIGVFLTFYILNLWNMQSVIATEYIVYAAFVIVFINGVYIWSMIFAFHRIRKNSDITAENALGKDINEAYLFGKLGLIVVDDNGTVLWISDLFLERQLNFINENIYDVFPKLKDFNEKDVADSIIVQHNTNVYYSVKYLKNAHLFIFKDITEYEQLYSYSKNNSLVLGTIVIDNYSDITQNDEDNNDLILKVRSEIIDYFRQYNVLIRHTKSDSYFAVCSFECLNKMKKDKFSILDDVKACGKGETVIPTLSISFAHDFPDVNRLNEKVNDALQTALARGGDQVVIVENESELEFYGGKTEATEKRNKVQVRVTADSLKTLIDASSNVVLMGHMDMDMDALGACLGVKTIVESRKKPVSIIFENKLCEKKARYALTSLYTREQLSNFIISTKEALDKIKPSTLLIVCDVSRPSYTMFPKALELTDKVAVIDHHRRPEEFIDSNVFNNVEPSASSTCEMIAEYIKYGSNSADIKLDPTSATIMLSGIFLDTGFYKNKSVGLRTFESSMILKEYGADNSLAYDLLKDEYEEYALVNKIITSMQTPHYGVVYCKTDEDEIVDGSTLAKAANKCMELKGINAVFVIGKISENVVKVSARSDGTVNVQILVEKFGGGGHLTQAAAAFKNQTISQVEETLLNVLNDYLNEARSGNVKGE